MVFHTLVQLDRKSFETKQPQKFSVSGKVCICMQEELEWNSVTVQILTQIVQAGGRRQPLSISGVSQQSLSIQAQSVGLSGRHRQQSTTTVTVLDLFHDKLLMIICFLSDLTKTLIQIIDNPDQVQSCLLVCFSSKEPFVSLHTLIIKECCSIV